MPPHLRLHYRQTTLLVPLVSDPTVYNATSNNAAGSNASIVNQIKQLIRKWFKLSPHENIIGLYDEVGDVFYPFSLVFASPLSFSSSYELVVSSHFEDSSVSLTPSTAPSKHFSFIPSSTFDVPPTLSFSSSQAAPPRTSASHSRKSASFDSSMFRSNPPASSGNFYPANPNAHLYQFAKNSTLEGQQVPNISLTQSEKSELNDLRNRTRFASLPASIILDLFQSWSENGKMSRDRFNSAVSRLFPVSKLSQFSTQNELCSVLERMFELFDRNNDGIIDVREFYTGLSLLCTGTTEEKVILAFQAYDADGDGYISLAEMIAYFTSFFTICGDLSDDLRNLLLNTTPQQIAVATAQQCFKEADTDMDGKISFKEFSRWFNESHPMTFPDQIQISPIPPKSVPISFHHRGQSFSDLSSFYSQQFMYNRQIAQIGPDNYHELSMETPFFPSTDENVPQGLTVEDDTDSEQDDDDDDDDLDEDEDDDVEDEDADDLDISDISDESADENDQNLYDAK